LAFGDSFLDSGVEPHTPKQDDALHTGFDKVLVHSLTKKPALTQYLSESHVRAKRGNVPPSHRLMGLDGDFDVVEMCLYRAILN